MLSSSVIDNLKCTFCRNSLSIFPIHTYGDKDTVTCGRCPVKNDFLPQREILYEEVAQHLEFACQNQSRGCIERLRPTELEEHEKQCLHKPCFCPVLPVCEYDWKGDHSELYEHVSTYHPTSVFRNVEVDLLTSYQENYLLFEDDETFIIQLKCDAKDGKFYCSVQYCCEDAMDQKFSYETNFTDNKTNFSLAIRNVQKRKSHDINSNSATVNITDIISKLNNPGCVICKVSILKPKPSLMQHCDDSINCFSNLVEDENEMLKTLECPVCFCYMIAPITQCSAGHSFCESHKIDLKLCPICQGSFGDIRNYLLEKITEIIAYPCKYNKYNCKFSASAKTIREHEAICKQGPYKCIMENCDWEDKYSDLKSHLRISHKDHLLEINSITYILDPDAILERNSYIILTGDNIFRLIFVKDEDVFYWSLRMLGDDYHKYMLELDLTDSVTKEKIYLRKRCGPFRKDYEIDDDYFVELNTDNLRNFIGDNIFTFKPRVLEMN